MQARHKNYEEYFRESYESSEKHYISYLKHYLPFPLDGSCKVLEVGCGLGGNIAPFAALGCNVSGVDINALSIDWAQRLFSANGLDGTFACVDIHEYDDDEKYRLIMMHDAIEHIAEKESLMHRLHDLLSDDGVLYIAFPAWHMPFGGHQQVAHTKFVSRCPFIHLLPRGIYAWLLHRVGEPEKVIKELLSIRETRMTIQAFQRLCHTAEYEVLHRQLYFINPHYEIKFGLKPRRLWRWLSNIPYIRDFFSTSCHYVLTKRSKN